MRLSRTADKPAAAGPAQPVEPKEIVDRTGIARAVLDSVRANIFVTDPQLRVVFANAKANETTRGLDHQAQGDFRRRFQDLLIGSIPGRAEDTVRDSRGHDTQLDVGQLTIDAHVSRVQGPDGKVAGYAVAWENAVASGAEERIRQLTERLEETQEVSAAIQAVAGATEEMAASSNEIARNASEASSTVAEAVSSVQAANRTMSQLSEASGQINDIVKTITAVAEQTNLLALNATLEAARAGEMGKGFAVVAGEVKELSKQTKSATERITDMINSVQELSHAAVGAIDAISTVVERINRNQITIASAVEEQTATTREISANLAKAAQRAEGIAAFVTRG
jgi:predicted  nucleic acid-binding Zn-ribbon protein